MQDVKQTNNLTIRPLVVLASMLGFLAVYLSGILRGQPLVWVSVSSTVALVLLLGAGLMIESLLNRRDGNREPAAVYEPAEDRPGERRGS